MNTKIPHSETAKGSDDTEVLIGSRELPLTSYWLTCLVGKIEINVWIVVPAAESSL